MKSQQTMGSLIDEVLSGSGISPEMMTKLRPALHQHYQDATIMVDTHYPDVVETLYGLNDGKYYSVLSLSYTDEYTYILIPTEKILPRKYFNETLAWWKTTHPEAQGSYIGEVANQVATTQKSLIEILRDCTRTSRQATGSNPKPFDMPPMETMQRFYECGRKQRYVTEELAAERLASKNGTYSCHWCNGYHQGQPPTGAAVPHEIMIGRWRTAWRRYQGL